MRYTSVKKKNPRQQKFNSTKIYLHGISYFSMLPGKWRIILLPIHIVKVATTNGAFTKYYALC